MNIQDWLSEAKKEACASGCGMFLIHNGVVRATAKAQARDGKDMPEVKAMEFSCDRALAEEYRKKTLELPGILMAEIWLNQGILSVGDDIMYVLIGGDTRPHVVDALNYLVGSLKEFCVSEKELF